MLGQTLGHYRVIEKIGAGGMGVVYRARDEKLDRDVALKVLPAGALAEETARQRFQTEALALSRLNHPHICTIYEVGEDGGQTYIAMEFIEGRPLSALAGDGGLPPETIARYGTQIAGALAHAHDRGLIHRDLKGSNVMITPDGRAKVLDFGLAKRASAGGGESATQGPTEAGTVLGTLAYMAPEVLRGQPADSRSDLWALGVLLFEMAAGQLPFGGQSGFEISSAILRESPRPLPPRIPVALRGAIQRCLAKEPGERYQRASEIEAVLEAVRTETLAVPVELPGRAFPWPWAAAAALAALVVAVAFNVGGVRDRLPGRSGGAASAPHIESLAVLPLENLSRDPEQEYFADGMTEQLIADLAKIGTLRVISRTSVMQYKGARKLLPTIARELKVDAIVAGSVLRAGDRVRITAQLIDAATDKHLWAESYERDLRDVLALQNEVARQIAREIRATLTPDEQKRLAAEPKVDPEVHRLTLQGKFQANKLAEEPLRKAIGYFEQAIAKDPNYAPAYAGLAFAYATLSSVYARPRDVMPQAKAAALQAIRLDDTLAEARIWLGYILFNYDWDWPGVERELKRALERNPSSAEAYVVYSNLLVSQNRMPEAIAAIRRAQQLDPLSLWVQSGVAGAPMIYLMARDYDRAIAESRQAQEIDPSYGWTHAALGLAYVQKGDLAAGLAAYDKAAQLDSSPLIQAMRAHGYAVAGKRREAEKFSKEVKEVYRRSYLCAYEIALTHVALGEKDQAFEWLNRAIEDRGDCIPYLGVDPRMDPIRSDPRFQKLLERVALAPRASALLPRARRDLASSGG